MTHATYRGFRTALVNLLQAIKDDHADPGVDVGGAMIQRELKCDCGHPEGSCECTEPTFWSWEAACKDDEEAEADKPLVGWEEE